MNLFDTRMPTGFMFSKSPPTPPPLLLKSQMVHVLPIKNVVQQTEGTPERRLRKSRTRRQCFHATITAPFNNMRTLKFKARPTNAFFATVKCSAVPPSFRLLPSAVIKSNRLDNIVESWEEPPNS